MEITRQHEQTNILEIAGKVCQQILAITDESDDLIIFTYLLVEDTWLRFYLDSGLLFVDQCDGPDPEDDLDEGENYVDLTEQYNCAGKNIQSAVMEEGIFRLTFLTNLVFEFSQINDETHLSVKN